MKIKVFDDLKDHYWEMVDAGKSVAESKSICITGLARNVADRLPVVLDSINEVGKLFKQHNIVIYENDSTDRTPQILNEWSQQSSNRHLISEQLNASHPCGPSSKSNLRTEALALYRNKCKNHIHKNFSYVDYVLVIDLDFLFYSIEGILNTLGLLNSQSDIHSMAGISYLAHSNKTLTNYDSWAYRHTWWHDHQIHMSWFGVWFPFIGSYPFKVNSAFGGSVLYNTNMYLSSNYEGYDCEHVCFHKNIHKNNPKYNLYINPSQIMVL